MEEVGGRLEAEEGSISSQAVSEDLAKALGGFGAVKLAGGDVALQWPVRKLQPTK